MDDIDRYTVPVINRDIRYHNAGERLIKILIPEYSEIVKASFQIHGRALATTVRLDGADKTLSDFDPVPNENKEITASSVIVDFHQRRAVHGIEISGAVPVGSDFIVCVLRVWGGSQWYLPLPRNILKFTKDSSNISLNQAFPPIKTEKLLLSFVQLKSLNGDSSPKDLSGSPADDLMEIMSFDNTKAVEEEAPITIKQLRIRTKDNLSGLTLGFKEKPPMVIEAGEFVTEENKPVKPGEITGQLNQAVKDISPLKADQLVIPGYLKEYITEKHEGTSYHNVVVSACTATSGTLNIDSLDLEHIFIINELSQGENLPPAASQTLDFKIDEMRRFISANFLFTKLPDKVKVKAISFNIKGSLSSERRIEPELVAPVQQEVPTDKGIKAEGGTKIFSFFKTSAGDFNVKAVEIRIKPLTDTLNISLSVLKDIDGKPDINSDPLAAGDTDYKPPAGEQTGQAGNQWIRIDFGEKSFSMENNVPYWLSLEVIEGELSWQAVRTPESNDIPIPNIVRENGDGEHRPCGPHLKSPITLISRFCYIPGDFKEHLIVKAGEGQACEIAVDNIVNMETSFQLGSDIAHPSGSFPIEIRAKSEGTLEVSNFILKYKDKENKIFVVIDENIQVENDEIIEVPQKKEGIPLRERFLDAPVIIIDGIGYRYAKLLADKGINSVRDLAEIEKEELSGLSRDTGIKEERLDEFVSRALAVKFAFKEDFPKIILSPGKEIINLRRMSYEDISKNFEIDIASASKIKQTVTILYAVTDASVTEQLLSG